jgi:hypothetical protein
MTDWAQIVKRCFQIGAVLYTSHARREMKQEPLGEISEQEVYEAALSSEVLEEYPEDTPYPSALLLGRTLINRPVHLVCAYDEEDKQIIVITVYHPDARRWEDYKVRRR